MYAYLSMRYGQIIQFPNSLFDLNEPSLLVKNMSGLVLTYSFMPTSPPKAKIDSTKPASIAGIKVGNRLTTQCLHILPYTAVREYLKS